MKKPNEILRLIKDILGFAKEHKAYWIIPIIIVLMSLTFLIIVGESVAPFIYTLF